MSNNSNTKFEAFSSACYAMDDGTVVEVHPGTKTPVDPNVTIKDQFGSPSIAAKVGAYESREDMLKDIRDKRYGRDRAFTKAVEQKALNSKW